MAKRGTAPAILKAAEDLARVADRIGGLFAADLRDVFRQVERSVLPLLARAEAADTPSARAAAVGATQQQYRAALRAAGFDALAEGAYGGALYPLMQRIFALRRAAGLSGTMTPAMQLQLEALGTVYRIDLLGEGDNAARALWRAAARGVFGGSNVRTILNELRPVVDRTEAQIRTLYDTSVSVLGRQVEAIQAGDDPETLFAFVGPVDDLTRPWCLQHIGKVYTRAEIDELDNGQIGPVFLTGGGYSCRHSFVELSKASELRDLHATGGRIPEMADQIAELKAA